MLAERTIHKNWDWNLINKCCLGQFIVGINSCVSCSPYLRFRCGFRTSRNVCSSHIPLKRKTCSTGLQRTAGTATSQCRTVGGCTMTNASSRTPNLITTMRPTRRRRRVAVLPYCYWLLDIAMVCIVKFVIPRHFVSVWPDVRVCCVLMTVICVVNIIILVY